MANYWRKETLPLPDLFVNGIFGFNIKVYELDSVLLFALNTLKIDELEKFLCKDRFFEFATVILPLFRG